ncbi:hypothetical protein BDP27DRAFT_1433703 [Rhodocollybia butyracea]|uniref:Uncharacterized protein n=1 Tax=Rhodocollybia butyracea TaxID=206335 RepID=A0A9P5TY37_9AGAR|nr:hypothetical protein BDP27DRAFT_1433703 [Rhodocollybia butyracea]
MLYHFTIWRVLLSPALTIAFFTISNTGWIPQLGLCAQTVDSQSFFETSACTSHKCLVDDLKTFTQKVEHKSAKLETWLIGAAQHISLLQYIVPNELESPAFLDILLGLAKDVDTLKAVANNINIAVAQMSTEEDLDNRIIV